ncbi:MAG TPA: ankyrin repeat domain-containing protein [Gallionellaceae bacterium]
MNEIEQGRQATILNEAITAGDLAAVWSLLDNGVDAHAPDQFGQTPMFVAVRDGQAEIVRLLIDRGVDVNAPVEKVHGRGALYFAADRGHKEVVRELLDAGAKIDGLDSHGQSALWVCALSLANEALNAADKEGWKQGQNAHPTGRAAVAELLIESGADVNLAPQDAYTPAHFLRGTGIPRLIALLAGKEQRRSFWSRLLRKHR